MIEVLGMTGRLRARSFDRMLLHVARDSRFLRAFHIDLEQFASS